MAYITIDRLIELFGNDDVLVSIDRDGDGVFSPLETAGLQAHIDVTAGLINGKLQTGKYVVPLPLPLTESTLWLELCNGEMAICSASLSIGPLTEEKIRRDTYWKKQLDLIASGDLLVDAPQDLPPQSDLPGIVVLNRNQRLFTLETQRGYC